MRRLTPKKYNIKSFEPRGMCDRSQMVFQRSDIVKEYDYNATGLYWTGRWVYKEFLMKPTRANLMPPLFYDPKPVKDARPCWYLPDM